MDEVSSTAIIAPAKALELRVALTYDAAGRPKTVTLPDGIVETSTYDDASELSGITYTNGANTLRGPRGSRPSSWPPGKE